jgi:hypothetical protein
MPHKRWEIKMLLKGFLRFGLCTIALALATQGMELSKWQSFEHYQMEMNHRGAPLKLVVGCGHKHRQYHSECFTINYEKWGQTNSDINGMFPEDMPKESLGQFHEIFFENVNGGTTKYYKDAYKFLAPNGTLVDDMHNEATLSKECRAILAKATLSPSLFTVCKNMEKAAEATKETTQEALTEAGFRMIQFTDPDFKNERNNRCGVIVTAKKPEKPFLSQNLSTDLFINPEAEKEIRCFKENFLKSGAGNREENVEFWLSTFPYKEYPEKVKTRILEVMKSEFEKFDQDRINTIKSLIEDQLSTEEIYRIGNYTTEEIQEAKKQLKK